MSRFAAPIAEQIWDMKYRLKKADGTIIDQTVEDTWRRIARALAEPEGLDGAGGIWEDRFYEALEDFKFIPAGRIVAGAGTGRNVTLFNCFVMGTIPDSMDGIFSHLREAALTMQAGGGIGYDFSTLRPKGAHVKGVDSDASGPLTFMDCWDAMCRTVMSAGSRRGAMMATMRCDHPDIEDFITAKRDPARLRMFNMSVLVTDDFMEAVEHGTPWALKFEGKEYRLVDARVLWKKIMQSTYDQAEPGVIFIDRINKANNLGYCETISATNPCGEQPLPPYGACLLGSINLVPFIKNAFRLTRKLDQAELRKTVRTAVRMMDNVVDVSRFPLEQQEKEANAKRRIGLGVTGLANALMMLGIRYGSENAVKATDRIMRMIAEEAYLASVDLAKEKGAFPLFNAEEFLKSENMVNMPENVRNAVKEHGIRNALLTSIAPTGTISLYAGNVSSGIEPVFAHSYTRKVLQPDGSKTEERVVDYAVAEFERQYPGQPLPDYFVTAQDLSPMDHVRMQAAAQRWVDSSISKTVNVPEDILFEDFQEVYLEAYRSGCKGCTTYRPNAITGSVLSVEPKKEEPENLIDKALRTTGITEWKPDIPPRPEAMSGKTYKMKWPGYEPAIYITINDDADGNPFEVFFNSKGIEHSAWMAALSRTISAVFRRGGDVQFIAQELKEVFDPKGGAYLDGKYVPSMIAQIGSILERHMKREVEEVPVQKDEALPVASIPSQCPSCGEFAMVMQEGCMKCTSCGYSKCG
jgi:ribonucleoside-diphosphate reductase alpha chain